MPRVDGKPIRVRAFHPEGGLSRTKQSMAAETDINSILARWIAHGTPAKGAGGSPSYGDFSSGLEYHDAMNKIREAEQSFDSLPAHVRKHVRNDPGEFLDMAFNPERVSELEELGLVPEQIPKDPSASEPPVPEAGAHPPMASGDGGAAPPG